LVSSRSDYLKARKRAEYGRPGVYLLTGPPSGNVLRDQLYVGEADDVRDRVDQHVKGKDFWTTVIAFTSKDENLNKAHVRYLEARLVQLATEAGRVAVLNGTAPALPKLSEPDRADMEAYLRENAGHPAVARGRRLRRDRSTGTRSRAALPQGEGRAGDRGGYSGRLRRRCRVACPDGLGPVDPHLA
jgi:hypothetical protein